jgi:hypothetical protein
MDLLLYMKGLAPRQGLARDELGLAIFIPLNVYGKQNLD